MYYFPPRDDIWSVMRSLLGDFVGPFSIACGCDASFFLAFRALADIRSLYEGKGTRTRLKKSALKSVQIVPLFTQEGFEYSCELFEQDLP